MSTPIEMRKYLAYMRNGTPITSVKKLEETKKDMTMRNMLGKMRNLKNKSVQNLNEDTQQQLTTSIDRKNEETKITNYFEEDNVTITFDDFKVFGDGVILGASIDGQVQFIYKVTPDENTSGIEVNYLEGFDPQDPENEIVVKKIESYYDIFFKYWRSNIIQ